MSVANTQLTFSLLHPKKDDVPTSYYAIFDGHAGTDAAFYSAAQLHMKCIYNSKFTVDPGEALKEAFLATDHSFVYEHEHEVWPLF